MRVYDKFERHLDSLAPSQFLLLKAETLSFMKILGSVERRNARNSLSHHCLPGWVTREKYRAIRLSWLNLHRSDCRPKLPRHIGVVVCQELHGYPSVFVHFKRRASNVRPRSLTVGSSNLTINVIEGDQSKTKNKHTHNDAQ